MKKYQLASLIALAFGLLALFAAMPDFLFRLEIATGSALALAYGFSAASPRAPAWLSSRPVVGMLAIYGGVIVVFIPVQFLISAMLLGVGTRLCMISFDPVNVNINNGRPIGHKGDIVIRDKANMEKRMP